MKKLKIVGGGNHKVIPHTHQIHLVIKFNDKEDIYPLLKSLGVAQPSVWEDDDGKDGTYLTLNAHSKKYHLKVNSFEGGPKMFKCDLTIGCNDVKKMSEQINKFGTWAKPKKSKL